MSVEKEKIIPAARYIAALLLTLNFGEQKPNKPDDIGYRTVYTLAKRHSLSGALWYVLEDEITATGDTELIERFRRDSEIDYAKNLVQTREFSSVTEAFSRAEIRFLPLKGFLNKALWARPEYRSMTDMDIYVSADGIKKAGELLVSLGYERDHGGEVHDSYVKPPYVNIELHKTLANYGDGDFSAWKPREDNPCFYEMSDEDALVFNLAHMYKHYYNGGSGMRSFFDLYLFLRAKGNSLDNEYVMRELSLRGMEEFYSMARRLSDLWFGGVSDFSDELAELEYYIVTGGTFGTLQNRVETAMKKKSGCGYTLSRAFLPYSKMKHIYKWLVPLPFLLPVAWIARLAHALFDGRMGKEMRATKVAVQKKKDQGA